MDNYYRDLILRFGLIAGLFQILVTLVAYLIGIEYLVSFTVMGISFIIVTAIVIYSGVVYRKKLGGFIDFKTAFRTIFLVSAAAGLLAMLFNLTLYNVIDPELPAKMQEAIIDKTIGMMEKFGAPDDAIDKTIEEMKEKQQDQFSATNFVLGFFYSLIWYALIAAIASAIIKKQKPFEGSESLDA
jgi:hypothetical protein